MYFRIAEALLSPFSEQKNKMNMGKKNITDKVRGCTGNGVLNEPTEARGSQTQPAETAAGPPRADKPQRISKEVDSAKSRQYPGISLDGNPRASVGTAVAPAEIRTGRLPNTMPQQYGYAGFKWRLRWRLSESAGAPGSEEPSTLQ
jgi:hypothetical protein